MRFKTTGWQLVWWSVLRPREHRPALKYKLIGRHKAICQKLNSSKVAWEGHIIHFEDTGSKVEEGCCPEENATDPFLAISSYSGKDFSSVKPLSAGSGPFSVPAGRLTGLLLSCKEPECLNYTCSLWKLNSGYSLHLRHFIIALRRMTREVLRLLLLTSPSTESNQASWTL